MMFIFIAMGILLPTMHQSSLGTMMILAGHKLSPLWHTAMLPLLFLITALTMGYAVVVFESLFVSMNFNRPYETPLLSRIAKIIAHMIAFYLLLRWADLIYRGALVELLQFKLTSFMFVLENILFIYPMLQMYSKAQRNTKRGLFFSAVSMLLAGSLYRFNVYIIGFNPGEGYHYFPSFQEIMITVGIISMEILLYLIFIKKLPVLPEVKHVH